MRKYILVLLVFASTGVKAQNFFRYSNLDYKSLFEVRDSAIKYRQLYNCSISCRKYDSIRYYKGRTIFFINQSEYYTALVFGADSVKSFLYYQPGEIQKKDYCKCDPLNPNL